MDKSNDKKAYYDGIRAAIASAKATATGHQTHLEGITLSIAIDAMLSLLSVEPKCKRCGQVLGWSHHSKFVSDSSMDGGHYVHPCGYGDVKITDC